ncbi:MAG: chloride channel protein [Ferruginibacter sp.]|nr:chloride channel protein [Ferruginibacter sp.]
MYDQLLRYIIRLNHWRKRHISQTTFLIIAAAIVGTLGGLASSILKRLTHLVANFLQNDLQGQYKFYLYFFFPIIGLFLTVFYIRLFIRKHTFRQGIPPLIKSISKNRSRLDFHNAYSQIISSAITVGMGGSAGLESPAVSSGASIGSNIGRLFGLNYRETTLLLACGGAAGISGAFDSPIAGMVFAIEVLLPAFSIPAITPLLISSAIASVVSWMVYNRPLFHYVADGRIQDGFWYYILFGILAGFYTVYYGYMNELIHITMRKFKNIYVKATIGGLALGLMVALFPALYGEGYITIQKLLDGDFNSLLSNSLFSNYSEYSWVLIIFATLSLFAKATASAVTLSSGGNGGMFGPSVVIGGLLGFIFAYTFNQLGFGHLDVTHFMLAGMAASVSGVMHAPLTGIFLSAEITGGYALMVPLMIVAAIAYFINKAIRKYSIYTKELAEEGELIDAENKDTSVLMQLRLKHLLEKDFVQLKPEEFPMQRKDDIIHSTRTIFPVVNLNGKFLGILTIEDLLEVIYTNDPAKINSLMVGDLVQPTQDVIPVNMPMKEVMQLMDKKDIHILPVTGHNNTYLGFVTREGVFNKYRQLLRKQNDLI